MNRIARVAALLVIVLCGGLLRLDSYVSRYGTLEHPAWARFITHDLAPAASRIRPRTVVWEPIGSPYVGGDPINYLRFAREMTSFYQPHVREPMFLAVTRGALWMLDGQDAAVSLASAIGSLLIIVATFLLGAAVISPLGGLAAALIVAIDYDLITWSVDGWRDDLFTAAVIFAAWAFVRFHGRPSFRNGILVGITSGIACLTRITALSFVLPALAWVALAGVPPMRSSRLTHAATALLITAALVAPFLISCAIATGDPFYAIDYHTSYYRHAEGIPAGQPMSAGGYLRLKFASHPLATLDTGLTGEFVRPFARKWSGLNPWSGWVAGFFWWTSLIGVLALSFSVKGRLLIVVLLGSLVPYAFTWNVGAGGEWRFTMHAYPLYVVAAIMALHAGYALAAALVRDPAGRRARLGLIARRAISTAVLFAAAAAVYLAFPWFVVREAIAKGDSVSIPVGERDAVFYRHGWSEPHADGTVIVRVSRSERAQVRFSLPDRKPRVAVLRLDPATLDPRQSVTVLFNQQVAAVLRLDWDPARVGAYRVPLAQEWSVPGTNELTFVTTPLVPAGSAGTRFAWLDPSQRIGVRVWYVRVLPSS